MTGSKEPIWRISSGRGLLQSTFHQSKFPLMHSRHFNLSGIEKLGHSYSAGVKVCVAKQVSHIGSLEQEKCSALGLPFSCVDTIWLFISVTRAEVNLHILHLKISLTS